MRTPDKIVLVVDDSESIREMVRFTLANAGYKVLASQNAVEALQYLDNGDVDLILTDLHMPETDGISLIRQIRANSTCQYVPVLVLTTESQIVKKQEAKAAGATGWIVKPFAQDKLLTLVQRLIG